MDSSCIFTISTLLTQRTFTFYTPCLPFPLNAPMLFQEERPFQSVDLCKHHSSCCDVVTFHLSFDIKFDRNILDNESL